MTNLKRHRPRARSAPGRHPAAPFDAIRGICLMAPGRGACASACACTRHARVRMHVLDCAAVCGVSCPPFFVLHDAPPSRATRAALCPHAPHPAYRAGFASHPQLRTPQLSPTPAPLPSPPPHAPPPPHVSLLGSQSHCTCCCRAPRTTQRRAAPLRLPPPPRPPARAAGSPEGRAAARRQRQARRAARAALESVPGSQSWRLRCATRCAPRGVGGRAGPTGGVKTGARQRARPAASCKRPCPRACACA